MRGISEEYFAGIILSSENVAYRGVVSRLCNMGWLAVNVRHRRLVFSSGAPRNRCAASLPCKSK